MNRKIYFLRFFCFILFFNFERRKHFTMKNFLLLIFTFLTTLLFSQQSNFGNWLIYIGNVQLNERWNWHSEYQNRNYNAIGDIEQHLVRTGIGYNLSENNNNLLLGYGFVHSENYSANQVDKTKMSEHRIYQQFITKQDFGRVKFQHRYRFEQRFIEDKFRLRFRYFIGMVISLNNPELIENTYYFSFYNELFIQPVTNSVFDRNRIFGGLGYKINKNIRLELGYMNQFFALGQRDQLNVFAYLNF